MALNVRIGRPEEWQEILDVSHKAFNFADNTFPNGWPHTYPNAQAAEWFVVCERAGHIIGVINQTPADVNVGGARMKGVGIGGVGVLPEVRGRGAMSAMLAASNRWQREAGTVMGFLGGERIRYRNYGYEQAGVRLGMHIGPKALVGVKPVRLRRLGQKDVPALLRLHAPTPLFVWRDELWLSRVLLRPGYRAHGNATGPLRAYVVVDNGTPPSVIEFAGDGRLLPGVLKEHFTRHKMAGGNVPLLQDYAPHAALARVAGHISAGPAIQVCIFDFERFLRGIAPLLGKHFRQWGVTQRLRIRHTDERKSFELKLEPNGSVSVKLIRSGKADLSLNSAEWIRTFFPPPGGPMLSKEAAPCVLAALAFPLSYSNWEAV